MFSHPSVSTDSRKPSCWLRQCLIITFLSLLFYLECSSFERCNVLGISYSLLQLPGTIPSIFSLHAIFWNPTFQLSRLRHILFSEYPMNFTYGIGNKMCADLSTLPPSPAYSHTEWEKTFYTWCFPPLSIVPPNT